MKKILIIEDDISIGEVERDYLEQSGFEVKVINDGHKGYEEALANDYDLLILDTKLSSMNAFNFSKELKEYKTIPIIVVTSIAEEIEGFRRLGLPMDDYMTKPFSPNELVARVKALLSRYESLRSKAMSVQSVIEVRNISINVELRQVFVNDKEIELTEKEFELLYLLVSTPNKIFSKDEISKSIGKQSLNKEFSEITAHIRKLREKIEFDPSDPEYIETIWGLGYKFKI